MFHHVGKIQVPSNVTRIARSFERMCAGGSEQIVMYQCGVGTGNTLSDIVTGGAFGHGIAEVSGFVASKSSQSSHHADRYLAHQGGLLLRMHELY